jgi:hypothetical protein
LGARCRHAVCTVRCTGLLRRSCPLLRQSTSARGLFSHGARLVWPQNVRPRDELAWSILWPPAIGPCSSRGGGLGDAPRGSHVRWHGATGGGETRAVRAATSPTGSLRPATPLLFCSSHGRHRRLLPACAVAAPVRRLLPYLCSCCRCHPPSPHPWAAALP